MVFYNNLFQYYSTESTDFSIKNKLKHFAKKKSLFDTHEKSKLNQLHYYFLLLYPIKFLRDLRKK